MNYVLLIVIWFKYGINSVVVNMLIFILLNLMRLILKWCGNLLYCVIILGDRIISKLLLIFEMMCYIKY